MNNLEVQALNKNTGVDGTVFRIFDPDPVPNPSHTHVGHQKTFFNFYSQHCQFTIYLSCQRHWCYNFQYFRQFDFWKKHSSGFHLAEMESIQMDKLWMPISIRIR
jgi:hypothetical protein